MLAATSKVEISVSLGVNCSAVMGRPPRIPVWLSLDQPVVYYITICVARRERVLNNPDVLAAVRMFCSSNTNWLLLSAVIMPDHLHALVAPMDRDAPVTQFSAGLKRHVRRAVHAEWHWQEGVFDRLLRRDESAETKWL
jgi:REP element-mobilizing transposase RayT